jgi:hypothetical protein
MSSIRGQTVGTPIQPPRGTPRWLAPLLFRALNFSRITRSREELERLPVVGGMSSIPTRAADLERVLDRILPQVDRLHLFLHGYDAIPETARRRGISAYLAPADHPFRASGKLYGLLHEPSPCLYFGFDDDILYLRGHGQRLRNGLIRYGGLVIVGIHAARFSPRHRSYLRAVKVRHFAKGWPLDVLADELGSGTVAFYSAALPVDPRPWSHGNMEDLMMAVEAERRHLPRIALARPANSLVAIGEMQPDSLFHQLRRDDSAHSAVLAQLRALMGRALPTQ